MKKIISLFLAIMLISSFAAFAEDADMGTKIEYSSDWIIEPSTESMDVRRAFDGSRDTYWHTYFKYAEGGLAEKADCPHVLTITFPEERNISGWSYVPRNDNASGIFLKYEIYASGDGESFKLIYEGDMPEYASGINAADFPPHSDSWGNVSLKAIKIVATETRAGYGTAGEIEFYENGSGKPVGNGREYSEESPDGEKLSDIGWQITASTEAAGMGVNLAFDGNSKSYWHTPFGFVDGKTIPAEYPHFVTITFPEMTTVSGLLYYPRTDNATGTFKDYNLYVSTDGENFTLEKSGSFIYAPGSAAGFKPSYIYFGDKELKAIKFEAVKALGNHGSAAEIVLYSGEPDPSVLAPVTDPLDFDGEEGEHSAKFYVSNKTSGVSRKGVAFINREGIKVSVSSDQSATLSQMFDGDVNTYWHTNFKAVGGNITEHDMPPHYIKLILPKATEISGLSLLPRQDVGTGSFNNVNIYASETDDGEFALIKENVTLKGTTDLNEIYFAANIKVKKLRIEATSTKSGYGTMAELNLLDRDDAKKTLGVAEFKEYDEANTLCEIDNSLFTASYDGINWGNNSPEKIFDGADNTFWQTGGLDSGKTAVLKVDLGGTYEISRIEALPRLTDDFHGCWMKVNVYGSIDGENYDAVAENVTFEKNLDIKEFNFEKPVNARYLEFEITGYFGGRVSLSELKFYQTKEAREKFIELNKECYVLKIDSKSISYTLKGEDGVKEIDVAPFIVNGSTMIPLRGLLELMGAEITWYGEDQSIDIDNGTFFIHLQIDNKLVYVRHPIYGDIRYTLLSKPVISEGRTFIPLRFVSEQLGYNVSWNGDTQEITITNK